MKNDFKQGIMLSLFIPKNKHIGNLNSLINEEKVSIYDENEFSFLINKKEIKPYLLFIEEELQYKNFKEQKTVEYFKVFLENKNISKQMAEFVVLKIRIYLDLIALRIKLEENFSNSSRNIMQ
jgi:hypothetical protein